MTIKVKTEWKGDIHTTPTVVCEDEFGTIYQTISAAQGAPFEHWPRTTNAPLAWERAAIAASQYFGGIRVRLRMSLEWQDWPQPRTAWFSKVDTFDEFLAVNSHGRVTTRRRPYWGFLVKVGLKKPPEHLTRIEIVKRMVEVNMLGQEKGWFGER